MQIITVVGLASGNSRQLEASPAEMSETLMDWLMAKGITIASSCGGEGVCRKCSIQNGWLSCSMTLEEFFQRQPDGRVEVSYL